MMICRLNQVCKQFISPVSSLFSHREKIRAVENVSLEIARLETLSIVGESGSGKTTLGRIIADLYRPDSGEVFFEEDNLRLMDRRKYQRYRQSVQVVFQDPYSSLDPRFTVQKILKEAFTLQRDIDRLQKNHLMSEMLTAVGLSSDILIRYPHEFSGGERQRIAIARALLSQPQLVILDEAVSSLDVVTQRQILKLLNELKIKFHLTYVFISHNLRVVNQISDRIAVMFGGRILEIGSTKEIIGNPLHPYTKELLAAAIDFKPQKSPRNWTVPLDGSGRTVARGHWVMDVV